MKFCLDSKCITYRSLRFSNLEGSNALLGLIQTAYFSLFSYPLFMYVVFPNVHTSQCTWIVHDDWCVILNQVKTMICNLHIYLLVFVSKSTSCWFFSPFHFTENLLPKEVLSAFPITPISHNAISIFQCLPLFEFCVFVTPPWRIAVYVVRTLVEEKPKNSHDWPSAYLVEVQTHNAMEPYYSWKAQAAKSQTVEVVIVVEEAIVSKTASRTASSAVVRTTSRRPPSTTKETRSRKCSLSYRCEAAETRMKAQKMSIFEAAANLEAINLFYLLVPIITSR